MSEATVKNSNALISAAALVVIVFGMQAAKVLIVPFLLAVFIALMTVRPMLWLQSHRVPSVLAALFIVLALMLGLGAVGTVIGSSIAEFTAALPAYQARLDKIVQGGLQFVAGYMEDGESITGLNDLVNPGWAMGLAAGLFKALQDVLTNTFLILFTMVFILLEASSIGVKVKAAFGRKGSSLDGPRRFLNDLGRYLGIKTGVSLVTGLLAGLLTWAVGLDFPLLWGMLAFLLNYIPTVGSIIAAVPAVLMGLVQLGPAEATTIAIGFLAINVVFGNILEPRLMGYGVGISPLVVFIGLVFWGWVFGPVGMLLAVPLTMTLKLALESDDSTRWIAILIGSERDAEHALQKRAARSPG
ncbi:MAG: AI-2E family transporter [Gammaproteobacteria bacterium]|nr:AI-2E family transporter [Gammaproteobacteria bacterium]MDH4315317.1 AI-2E family transporter [Gammaproteobacteria bacterium]MDH5213432.1 AI-2E family transporter [Gammaproteobacteria bacterium]MDH5500307.1 AI-2E family transporter [Gammaproteobacteria bacterium]